MGVPSAPARASWMREAGWLQPAVESGCHSASRLMMEARPSCSASAAAEASSSATATSARLTLKRGTAGDETDGRSRATAPGPPGDAAAPCVGLSAVTMAWAAPALPLVSAAMREAATGAFCCMRWCTSGCWPLIAPTTDKTGTSLCIHGPAQGCGGRAA
eukprot:scaffold3535_cov107-Isochrysis_galbana.AAC.3